MNSRIFKVLVSRGTFDETESRLRVAIESREFRLFAVIDHGAGANSIGRNIGESKLFIFGNPMGGTPLLEATQSMGLELPLKILISQLDDGAVQILYHDVSAIAADHSVTGLDANIAKISGAVEATATEAAAVN